MADSGFFDISGIRFFCEDNGDWLVGFQLNINIIETASHLEPGLRKVCWNGVFPQSNLGSNANMQITAITTFRDTQNIARTIDVRMVCLSHKTTIILCIYLQTPSNAEYVALCLKMVGLTSGHVS